MCDLEREQAVRRCDLIRPWDTVIVDSHGKPWIARRSICAGCRQVRLASTWRLAYLALVDMGISGRRPWKLSVHPNLTPAPHNKQGSRARQGRVGSGNSPWSERRGLHLCYHSARHKPFLCTSVRSTPRGITAYRARTSDVWLKRLQSGSNALFLVLV